VLGYCTEAGEQAVDFELTVTQTPTAASFGLAMNDMTIAAGETKRFEFCASQPEDVQVGM
jgi:sporulation-control protein spo0M